MSWKPEPEPKTLAIFQNFYVVCAIKWIMYCALSFRELYVFNVFVSLLELFYFGLLVLLQLHYLYIIFILGEFFYWYIENTQQTSKAHQSDAFQFSQYCVLARTCKGSHESTLIHVSWQNCLKEMSHFVKENKTQKEKEENRSVFVRVKAKWKDHAWHPGPHGPCTDNWTRGFAQMKMSSFSGMII